MSNWKQPTMCCCLLPRSGIMSFTFLYTGYAFSGIFFKILGYIFTQKIAPHQVEDQGELFDFLFTWWHMVDVICGFIYFYAFILAYKRKWESLEYVLYGLMAIALYGIYPIYHDIKTCFTMNDKLKGPKPDELDDAQYAMMQKWIVLTYIGFSLVSQVIPWIIQLCLIKQMRTYIKYVLYKKETKTIPASSEKVQTIK
ncbi:hypothetical protein BCR42DRAFT_414527 [Absidia repens]|uniref:Transmembrane protein n=1 Tax=Absidia repens TaxID=90262 RepID=A0A1X2IJ96_9FUNG|nr:hypothetical protein BCR42DRAFT_414527 [Absidia repens]